MATQTRKASAKKVLKDPAGGLTAAGRSHYRETEGAQLKPGVKGPADTPEKMKRKGSFLRRHFANPNPGPMKDEKGQPTRRALSAQAWGEPVPETAAAVKKLAQKGTELLAKYHAAQEKPRTVHSGAVARKKTVGGTKRTAATGAGKSKQS